MTKAADLANLPNRLPADDAAVGRTSLGVYSTAEVDGALTQAVPPGVIFSYAGESAPTGFLLCDGSAVSRETYANLFAAIGTGYGVGDGSTTFNLPDLRGRAPIGAGQGSGLTDRSLGNEVGEEEHQLTIGEMPNHTHDVTRYVNILSRGDGGSTEIWDGTTTVQSGSDGGDGAHNNMQPSLAVNFIVKV